MQFDIEEYESILMSVHISHTYEIVMRLVPLEDLLNQKYPRRCLKLCDNFHRYVELDNCLLIVLFVHQVL